MDFRTMAMPVATSHDLWIDGLCKTFVEDDNHKHLWGYYQAVTKSADGGRAAKLLAAAVRGLKAMGVSFPQILFALSKILSIIMSNGTLDWATLWPIIQQIFFPTPVPTPVPTPAPSPTPSA